MPLKLKNGLCVKCNDGIPKPVIGKGGKALCEAKHYWPEHRASARRKDIDKIYARRRLVFLEENPLCVMGIPGCISQATEIHHVEGRGEDIMLDERYWLPACSSCHQYITDHSAEAYRLGVSKKRLEKKSNQQ